MEEILTTRGVVEFVISTYNEIDEDNSLCWNTEDMIDARRETTALLDLSLNRLYPYVGRHRKAS